MKIEFQIKIFMFVRPLTMWTVFLDVFDLLPPFWTNLLNFRHLISVYSLPHVGMCGQNTENIPRWFYVSFPTVFYNISGRRRTAKCNSSVSTDDHEDDFLTLEISHQEHFRTASQQLKMILEPRKSRIILGQKSLNHFSAQFSLTACTKLKRPKNPVKYAHQCKRKKYLGT